jgi:hypothetical protein
MAVLSAFPLLAMCPRIAEAQQPASVADEPVPAHTGNPSQSLSAPTLSDRESAFEKMLSGATLEGSFTNTSAGRDPAKLSREKYTLGKLIKLNDRFWMIPARIEYGEHDVTLPVTVPIEWAGDTPVIVIDNLTLPRFGAVSARVLFFDDHYAGYWKHGTSGGHLFGTIRREDASELIEPPADKPR